MTSHVAERVLSLAACWHSSLAVAFGSSVQTFTLDAASGQLISGDITECSHQISALATVELPDATSQVPLQGPWLDRSAGSAMLDPSRAMHQMSHDPNVA